MSLSRRGPDSVLMGLGGGSSGSRSYSHRVRKAKGRTEGKHGALPNSQRSKNTLLSVVH